MKNTVGGSAYIVLHCIAAANIALAGQASPDTGTITGAVSHVDGRPAPHIIVGASPVGRMLSTAIPQVETNESGQFSINRLQFGKYTVYSRNEKDGYPNTHFSFYSNGSSPFVLLTAEAPVATVNLSLGPKAATLRGLISDAATGKPVNAGMRLWRTTNPELWIRIGITSPFSVLIPPDTQVGIEITAAGYADWYYPGAPIAEKGTPLVLRSAQEATITVELQPKAP